MRAAAIHQASTKSLARMRHNINLNIKIVNWQLWNCMRVHSGLEAILGDSQASKVSEKGCPRSATESGAAQTDARRGAGRSDEQSVHPLRQQRQEDLVKVRLFDSFHICTWLEIYTQSPWIALICVARWLACVIKNSLAQEQELRVRHVPGRSRRWDSARLPGRKVGERVAAVDARPGQVPRP